MELLMVFVMPTLALIGLCTILVGIRMCLRNVFSRHKPKVLRPQFRNKRRKAA